MSQVKFVITTDMPTVFIIDGQEYYGDVFGFRLKRHFDGAVAALTTDGTSFQTEIK